MIFQHVLEHIKTYIVLRPGKPAEAYAHGSLLLVNKKTYAEAMDCLLTVRPAKLTLSVYSVPENEPEP